MKMRNKMLILGFVCLALIGGMLFYFKKHSAGVISFNNSNAQVEVSNKVIVGKREAGSTEKSEDPTSTSNQPEDDFPHEFYVDSPGEVGSSAEKVACELYKGYTAEEIDLCASHQDEIIEIYDRHPNHDGQIGYIIVLRNDQAELTGLVKFYTDPKGQGERIRLITNTVEPHPAAFMDPQVRANYQKGDSVRSHDRYPLIDESQAEKNLRQYLASKGEGAAVQRTSYVDLYLFAHTMNDYALVNRTLAPFHEFLVDGQLIWVDSRDGQIFTQADATRYEEESPDDHKTFDPEHGDFIDESGTLDKKD